MSASAIRLLQLRDASDEAGEVRVGLLIPPRAGSASKQPVLTVYSSISEALRAKHVLEVADARP